MRKILMGLTLVFASFIVTAQGAVPKYNYLVDSECCKAVQEKAAEYEITAISCSHTGGIMRPVSPAGLIVVSQDSIIFYETDKKINLMHKFAIEERFSEEVEPGMIEIQIVATGLDSYGQKYEMKMYIRERLGLIKYVLGTDRPQSHEVFVEFPKRQKS